MHSKGLVIQVDHPILGSSKGTAFEIDELIVSLGSFLIPLFFFKGKSGINNITDDGGSISLVLFKDILKQARGGKLFDSCRDSGLNTEIKFKVISQDLISKDVKLCFLHSYTKWPPKDFLNWSSSENNGNDFHKLLMGANQMFMFFTTGEPSKKKIESSLLKVYNYHKNNVIYPGLPIVVESTPFGNISFLNSWSHGIVSKELGSDAIVTDARLIYGCAGAPIYVFENGRKGNLIGVVVQAMTLSNGAWVGFSLGLRFKHVLEDVLRLTPSHDYIPFNTLPLELPRSQVNVDKVFGAVVFIRCTHKWGSGVVIDADNGIILTCSHIVHHAQNSVIVKCSGVDYWAKVEYCTPLFSPFDLAVLSVKTLPKAKSLCFANSPPLPGERVYTAGYPLSSESLVNQNSSPTLSSGIVSKVSTRGGPLQTTCCTQSGASGGALVRPPDQLLGIIVCNLKVNTTILPEYCFAVSAHDIKHTVDEYLRTRDASCLQTLCLENTAAKMEWSLMDSKL